MALLDSLPADQRAVLQLVLARGQSYDQIAQMLSIDRAAVRARALSAFDALGPQTGIDDQRRALITDYLLGQLPPAVALQIRDRLASTPGERAWARVLASELAPIASQPLPEIPAADTSSRASGGAERPAERPPSPIPALDVPVAAPAASSAAAAPAAPSGLGAAPPPRSSRLGGLILIGAAVVAAIVVAVVLLTTGGAKHTPAASAGSSTTSTPAAAPTSTSTTSSTATHVVAQINLKPPKVTSKAAGIAEVLKMGSNHGIAIVAQHVAPNTTKPPNAYAVWLYNSTTDAHLLGFINPGVGKSGRLSTAGGLPANASRFKQLIITLETKADPKTPGTIVLAGLLTGLS